MSVSCPLCGGQAPFLMSGRDQFYAVTDYVAHLYRCLACGTLCQHPVPDRATIAAFYPKGYWQETRGPKGLMARLQQTYIDWMLRTDLMAWIAAMNLPRGQRLLDVGCSRGDWLDKIRTAGYRVAGLEADPRAAAYARSRYKLNVTEGDGDTWDPAPASFEAITCFHLLEHLRDPAGFLDKAYRALMPGGKLLVRVPHIGGLQAQLLGARWKGLELPRHLTHFTRKALTDLLQQKGFVPDRVSTWALRDGPACFASSLFRRGEPTWQQIHGRPSAPATLVYLGLTWLLTPLEAAAALTGYGSMLTVLATRD